VINKNPAGPNKVIFSKDDEHLNKTAFFGSEKRKHSQPPPPSGSSGNSSDIVLPSI
jgi:hypothetical protein